MSSTISKYPNAKTMMSVSPVTWMPGSLAGTLPFFSVQNGVLYFRSDDANLYGINFAGGLMNPPRVVVNSVIKAGNKGRNFYSAPWCIPTLPSRDLGKRVEITDVDQSVFDYITSFYNIMTDGAIQLTNFSIEKKGYARKYQIVNGNLYTNVNGSILFGVSNTDCGIGGVAGVSSQTSPLFSDISGSDIEFNGDPITTYQEAWNTYWALDTPTVIRALDMNNPSNPNTLNFILSNNVTVYNQQNFTS